MSDNKKQLEQVESILAKDKAILLRGFEGTNKLGVAMEYLAKVFSKQGKDVGEIVRAIEDYNLQTIRAKYLEKKNIENGDETRGISRIRRPSLRRRFEELQEDDYSRITKEYIKDMPSIWAMLDRFGVDEMIEFSKIASYAGDTNFIVIAYDLARFAKVSNFLQYRDTNFFEGTAKVHLASNITLILIAEDKFASLPDDFYKVVSSIEIQPDASRISDSNKASLMNFLNNKLFKTEIKDRIVGLGEEYFQKDISMEQLLSDLEPVVYRFNRWTKRHMDNSLSMSEVHENIMKQIYDFVETLDIEE